MQTLTIKERIELGAYLAKAQTLVMRAFKYGIGNTRATAIDTMVKELVEGLARANSQQRFQIVDGTELCINLLSDRYRHSAVDAAGVEAVNHLERALQGVVTKAIEKTAEYNALAETYEDAPSVAA